MKFVTKMGSLCSKEIAIEKKFENFIQNVMTEPLECFLCLRPCAQVYENQYHRMPCMTATEIANPTNEVYMKDERYINFANFLAKFQKNRKENDEVRRRRLPYNWTKCLHFEFEYWKLERAVEDKNEKKFEAAKEKLLKVFFEGENTLGIKLLNEDENQRINLDKIMQELGNDLKLKDDQTGEDLTPEKLKTDYELGRISGQSNANLSDVYKHEYYKETKSLNVCCCYCI